MFWKVIATFALKQCIKLSFVRVYRETHEEGDGSLLFFFYILVGMYMKFPLHFMTFCVLKSYCSLCRENDADFHMSVFYSSSLASSSSCLLLAYELARCIIHKWVVLCNIHWQGYDFFSGEARQANEIIRTELEKIKRWPKPPLKVWKESLKLSRRIFDIHTLQR